MVVRIEEIAEKGLVLKEPVSQSLLAQTLEDGGEASGFTAESPAELTASFQKVSGGVLLKGSLKPHLKAPCKRCLQDVRLDVPVSFTLNLVPEPEPDRSKESDEAEAKEVDSDKRDSGGSFAMNDADREYFDGRTIDSGPDRPRAGIAGPSGIGALP